MLLRDAAGLSPVFGHNGAMHRVPTLTTPAKCFRFIALLEAFTWLGLLLGMAFKYLPADGTDIGVKVFGPLHGLAFLLYLPTSIWTAYRLRWGVLTTLFALLAAVPPFATAVFEVWSARTGRLAEPSTRFLAQSDLSLSDPAGS